MGYDVDWRYQRQKLSHVGDTIESCRTKTITPDRSVVEVIPGRQFFLAVFGGALAYFAILLFEWR